MSHRMRSRPWRTPTGPDEQNCPNSCLYPDPCRRSRNTGSRTRSSEVDPTSDMNRLFKQRKLERDSVNLKLSRSDTDQIGTTNIDQAKPAPAYADRPA